MGGDDAQWRSNSQRDTETAVKHLIVVSHGIINLQNNCDEMRKLKTQLILNLNPDRVLLLLGETVLAKQLC